MKNYCFNYNRFNVWILISLVSFIHSCGQRFIPQEMVGHWKTERTSITVRTQTDNRKFVFTSYSAIVTLIINDDYTAEGSIGSAKFENCKVSTNWLLPVKMSGIAFTFQCGKVGKIFENDPLDSKEVELWLGPLKDSIEGELRFTRGASHFPMAGFIITKEMNKYSGIE